MTSRSVEWYIAHPKYQKAYAVEGIAKKWTEDENEEDYVDTGDMLRDFGQILELSRELMAMLDDVEPDKTRRLRMQIINQEVKQALNDPLEKDELKALYKAYYKPWGEEALYEQLAQMEEDWISDPTLTIFRKYPDGDIVALFPEVEGAPGTCNCYVHVGQHGSAHYHHVIQKTKRATPEEYADLKTELESIGYTLKIRQKWMRRS